MARLSTAGSSANAATRTRAIKADAERDALRAEVERLRESLILAVKRIEWCAGLIQHDESREKGFDMAEQISASLRAGYQ